MLQRDGIYCSREEYESLLSDRLQSGSLTLNGLFTVYMRYRKGTHRPAVRCMGHILDLRGLEFEPPRISFALLDNDLRPFRNSPPGVTFAYSDGLLDPAKLSSNEAAAQNIVQGFFVAYDALTGYDDELRTMTEQPIERERLAARVVTRRL